MRQALSPRKLARYSRQYGLEFVRGLVRGGTEHRVDLWTADDRSFSFFQREAARLYQVNAAGELEEWKEGR